MSTTTSRETLTAAAYFRLILLGALIGIPAALVAAGFVALVHVLGRWLWEDLPDAMGHATPPWYLVIGLPVVGALIVLGARTLLPGDGGHDPLEGSAPSRPRRRTDRVWRWPPSDRLPSAPCSVRRRR